MAPLPRLGPVLHMPQCLVDPAASRSPAPALNPEEASSALSFLCLPVLPLSLPNFSLCTLGPSSHGGFIVPGLKFAQHASAASPCWLEPRRGTTAGPGSPRPRAAGPSKGRIRRPRPETASPEPPPLAPATTAATAVDFRRGRFFTNRWSPRAIMMEMFEGIMDKKEEACIKHIDIKEKKMTERVVIFMMVTEKKINLKEKNAKLVEKKNKLGKRRGADFQYPADLTTEMEATHINFRERFWYHVGFSARRRNAGADDELHHFFAELRFNEWTRRPNVQTCIILV
ncbi:hypothetical protein D1007_29241 [Hordeum vulgare]|nr:hypothetical protein D1007_29241 [Hordeum vulgare]